MRTVRVASVAIDRTAFHFDKPYDYLVPFDLTESAVEGCRVLVPFGRGNAKRQGIILNFADAAEVDKIKPIISVLDSPPLLSAEMLALAKWLKEQTFCT
jgi:primosomal protein N' (replication factor Y)